MAIAGMTNITGSVMMVVADLSTMLAIVEANETDVPSIVPGQKAKVKGQPRPQPPRLLGPPPCYLWVAGKCAGATCTQPPSRSNKGPHPHGWDKRDNGTPAQADFKAWVKKYF